MPETDSQEAYPLEADPSPPENGGETPGWRFKLAVLRHHRIVYHVALSLLRDRHEAEDASQEAFLRYWQHGGGVERPREWLLTVVRNACLDRLRRSSRVVFDDETAAVEGPAEERDPVWHLQQQELGDRLNGLIGALPEPQRSLVILFDVNGVDGASCAQILGLNVNQVKVYLHRARRKLRNELEGSS